MALGHLQINTPNRQGRQVTLKHEAPLPRVVHGGVFWDKLDPLYCQKSRLDLCPIFVTPERYDDRTDQLGSKFVLVNCLLVEKFKVFLESSSLQ
jgi:hypothetical protein